ncbi:MAG: hypothetical protein CMH25_03300 [Micavibrio sp.]|nr:hypothetical protein [Micavibrio sp.]
MTIYTLTFDISGVFSGPPPKLSIIYGGTKIGVTYVDTASSTMSFQIDSEKPINHSLLRFYSIKAHGSEDDLINISNIRINDNPIDMTSLSHNKGSSSDASTLTLTQGSYADFNAVDTIDNDAPPPPETFASIDGDNANNKIYGTDVADVINGYGGNDKIIAKDGNDTVNGGDGADVIAGQNGADILNGDAGNDIIYGNDGADTINGGDDDDRLYGHEGVDTIHGDAGNDRIWGGSDNDFLYGDDGDDSLSGELGNDQLFGGLGNDQLFGGDGNDILRGGDGDDRLLGNNGDDTIYGDAGADNIDGQLGNDDVYGGDGDDRIDGEQGNDTLRGEAGNDTIMGGLGSDVISGGDGNDIIHGGGVSSYDQYVIRENSAWGRAGVWYSEATNSFYRYVSGTANHATAVADAESSLLNGVAGHIVNITSQAENDFVTNMISGNIWINVDDTVAEGEWMYSSGNEAGVVFYSAVNGTTGAAYTNWNGGEPNDYGAGEDFAEMRPDGLWNDNTGTRGYVIEWDGEAVQADNSTNTLNGGNGDDLIYGGSGADDINGNADNDQLYGLGGNDIIRGEAGNDLLVGGAGNDTLAGGDDADVLFGNVGNDTLNGGNGDDILYALDTTVNTGGTGISVSPGSVVTVDSQVFDNNAHGFVYADVNDPANVDVVGSRDTDGNLGAGSLEVFIDGFNNSAFSDAQGQWSKTITFTEDLSDVQINFSYRHFHANQNDNGEDSISYYFLDGALTTLTTALGSGGTTDTGWLDVTIDVGSVTNGQSIVIDLGLYHSGSSRANEDAFVRFDDFSVVGQQADILTAGNTTTDADNSSVNIVNGDAGNDTIYGSSGNDTLNGGDGADTIYSGSVDSFTAELSAILAANPNVSYSHDTGNFYQVVNVAGGVNWDTANTAANSATLNGVTGHLGTIRSQTELDFATSLTGGGNTWLGGSDAGTEGVWRWNQGDENGIQFADAAGNSVNGNFVSWEPGQPNDSNGTQDYLYLLNGNAFADLVLQGDGSSGFVTVPQYLIEWEGSDVFASLNTTTLIGGTGNDNLYGSDGIDIFDFNDTTSQDTIYNFNHLGRDAIDISDIISFSAVGNNIDDFVQFTESGGNTIVSVDANGATGGANFTNVATINGVTGLNMDDMITSGTLIVN